MAQAGGIVIPACDETELICEFGRSVCVVVEGGVSPTEGCAIPKGVRIGKRSVVGANAVATKDVPAYTVVAGVPARIIRRIDLETPPPDA